MKIPDYLPKASDAIDQAVEIISRLLDLKVAYWNQAKPQESYMLYGKLIVS